MNINIYFVLTFWLFSFGGGNNISNKPDASDKTAVFAVATVQNVTAIPSNGFFGTGDIIEISIEFDLPVDVTGVPGLALNTGDFANYVSGSGTAILVFEYEVNQADDITLFDTENLNYDSPTSLILNGGTIMNDSDAADLSLPGLGSPNSLEGNTDIIIDTTEPQLDADPFSPDNNSLNVDIETGFSITFAEPVSGSGIGNIQIVDAETSLAITLDAATAFTNSNATQLNFDTDLFTLNPSTKYYITFAAGAISDEAGNEFAGFASQNTWAFSTFGPPVINTYPTAACPEEVITIEGDFFTGLTRIIINEGVDEVIIPSADFISLTETTVSFEVPADAMTGIIKLEKVNGTTVSTLTDDPIKIGPHAAELIITGDQYLCFDSVEGTLPTSEISIEIEGGSGSYTVVYSENGVNTTINNYNSGDAIAVTPPDDEENDYALISVTDTDPELSGCIPPLGSTKTITRFRRSVVEAGGDYDAELGFGVVELCVSENNRINLGSGSEMNGNFPSIQGSVVTGQWSIFQGPANSGGFNPGQTNKTSNNIGATYYPSFSEVFAGEVTLRLISNTPSNANNTCAVSEDFLKIKFVSQVTANPGPAPDICKDQDDNQVNLVQLNASSDGDIEWSLDDDYYIVAEYDNTWGFAETANATTFTATSDNPDAYYRAKEEQLIDEDVVVKIIPLSSSSACSISPTPIELNIPVYSLPQPSNLSGPFNVCSGANAIRFSVEKDPNFTNNTFEWTITDSGNNQFDGGTSGSSVFVNFKEVSSSTVETISVREINSATGCVSEPINFNVTIQPLPNLTVDFTGGKAFSQSAGLLPLQGGASPIITTTPATGGVFSGPGVVLNSDSLYYINPASLSETNLGDMADDHIITFTYENAFGCENSIEFGIDIFNADDIFPQLAIFYCETDEAVNISVNTDILESNQTVISIDGPGVTYNSGNSATFNPEIARSEIDENSNIVNITYSVYNGDTDSDIINVASQSIQVIQNPSPVFIGINDFYCSDESNIFLLRNANLNPNGKFNFSLVDNSLPDGLITGDSTNGYFFNPNQLDDMLLEDDSLSIDIRYSYFNSQDCQNDTVFSTLIYRKPSAPLFEKSELCIVNGIIDTAKVINAGEFNSESIQWYLNDQLGGDPIAVGASFIPNANLVADETTTFYAVRRNTQNSASALCLSPISAVTYKRIDSPEFDWEKSTYEANDSIEFTSQSTSIDLDSIRWVLEKEENGEFVEKKQVLLESSISSTYFDFNSYGPGLYRVSLYTLNDFGCSASVTEEMVILEELAIDNNFRFDFNNDSEGWVATGNNNSWEWAVPQAHSNASIENENALWITNADSTYNASERSYVYSPVFNLSQIEKPSVSFDLWLDITSGTDGLILEYATDNKNIEDPTKNWQRLGNFENNVSSGINWYNRSGIRSAPGTGNNNLLLSGWTTIGDSLSARVPVKHILDVIPNRERVLFRFHFATTESSNLLDGVAFDNFNIESRNRTVLVEYFGNDTFSDDTQEMAFLNARSQNSTDFTWINYRVNENDPFFMENGSATLSRMFFYNAYSSESTFSLDGNYFESGLISNNNQNQNTLNQRALVPSPMELAFDITEVNSDELEIQLNLTSNITLDEQKKLHVIVVNDELVDEDKTYYHVLRKFLTPPTGFIPENETTFSYSYKVTNSLDTLPLSVVAFIQDDSIGNILQAATQPLPKLSTNLVLSNNPLEIDGLTVFPNPAKNSIKLYSKTVLKSDIKGRIVDLTGKPVREFTLKAFSKGTELDTKNLVNGLFTIQLWNDSGKIQTIKLVVKH